MGGLLVATVLTLIVLPVLYVTLFGDAPAPAAGAEGAAGA
jgi:Cu/Ag efflux pump CusA